MRRLLFSCAIGLVLELGLPRPASAQAGDSAAAEALFQEGKALLEQGKYAEACPKLAESNRLDPATGTLLALAMCHEGQNKLASAWAEYTEVAVRARREGREDRERAARQKTEDLRSKLPLLTLQVSPEAGALAGLEVKRDGIIVGRGAWGSAVPVDAGEHLVEASAPGKQPWSTRITMETAAHQSVTVPALSDVTTAQPAMGSATAETKPDMPGGGSPTLRLVGLTAAGVGVVGLGIGGFLDWESVASSAFEPLVKRPTQSTTATARTSALHRLRTTRGRTPSGQPTSPRSHS
jgi:hypothetical protein